MKGQKTLLVMALALVLGACGDDKKEAAASQDQAPTAPVAEKAPVAKIENQSAEAEKRFREYVAANNKNYSIQTGKINWTVDEYQAGAEKSTAKTSIEITVPAQDGEKQTLVLSAVTEIDNSPALLQQGLVARAVTKFNAIPDTSDSGAQFYSKLLQATTVTSEFTVDGLIKEAAVMDGVKLDNFNGEAVSVEFKGMNANTEWQQADSLKPIIPSSGTFEFKGVTVTGDDDTSVVIESFGGKLKQTENSLTASTDPLNMILKKDGKEVKLHAESLTVNGSNLSYDEVIGNLIGNTEYAFNNVSVSGSAKDFTAEFKSISWFADYKKNGDLYDLTYGLNVQPITDFVQIFAGIPNVKVQELNTQTTLHKIDADSINNIALLAESFGRRYQEVSAAGGKDDKEISNAQNEKLLHSYITAIASNRSNIDADVKVKTEAGDARLTADLKLKDNAPSVENDDNIDKYIENNGELNAELTVAKGIENATGLIAMLSVFVGIAPEDNGDNLIYHFKADKDSATLNDKKLK